MGAEAASTTRVGAAAGEKTAPDRCDDDERQIYETNGTPTPTLAGWIPRMVPSLEDVWVPVHHFMLIKSLEDEHDNQCHLKCTLIQTIIGCAPRDKQV